jgi:hypothetical protein
MSGQYATIGFRWMEPRYWMTGYTVSLVVALLALAARGFPVASGVVALAIFAFGAGLDAVYVGRRITSRLLAPRRRLDRIVRQQLLAIAVLGVATIAIGEVTGYEPLHHVAASVKAIVIGAVVGVGTVYVSSLVDWYWIMPKVSGTTGPGPCEHSGNERWAGVTNVWFFHRAVATSVVIGILAGVPAYIAGHSGSDGTAWALLGAALAVGYSSVNTGVRSALSFAFNAPIHVGDIIRVRADPEDQYLQDAYVVDVSIQGLKYMLVQREDDGNPRFTNKGEQLSMEELLETHRNRTAESPCPGAAECRAVNWYCHRNPLANTSRDPDEHNGERLPLPDVERAHV